MTTYNQATLKTFFQDGDIPDGNDYANLIDSCLNVVDTADQPIAGPISPTQLNTARVSAGNINITGTLIIAGITSATDIYADTVHASALALNGSLSITGTFSAAAINTNGLTVNGNITANGISVTSDVSANGKVVASAASFAAGIIQGVGIVSAAGSAQTTAAQLTFVTNRGQGVIDGTTTGFALQANRTGLTQYLSLEGATSANLWPPTGGKINNGSANTPFSLAGNALYTIVHVAASSYGVK